MTVLFFIMAFLSRAAKLLAAPLSTEPYSLLGHLNIMALLLAVLSYIIMPLKHIVNFCLLGQLNMACSFDFFCNFYSGNI